MVVITMANITGIIGVAMILLAYFLHVFRFISGTGKLFYVMNIIGAALACYASWLIPYWPFVILEGVWCLVSVAGLLKRKG